VADDGHPRRPPRDALALKLADAGALLGGGVHGEADRSSGELALVEVVGNRHRADSDIPSGDVLGEPAVITWSGRRRDHLARFELVEALGSSTGGST
jgi:hypothetical protein